MRFRGQPGASNEIWIFRPRYDRIAHALDGMKDRFKVGNGDARHHASMSALFELQRGHGSPRLFSLIVQVSSIQSVS